MGNRFGRVSYECESNPEICAKVGVLTHVVHVDGHKYCFSSYRMHTSEELFITLFKNMHTFQNII